MTAKPELVLHIGLGKTGTTSIQRVMAARREELAALGVHDPRAPGHADHELPSASLVKAGDRRGAQAHLDALSAAHRDHPPVRRLTRLIGAPG